MFGTISAGAPGRLQGDLRPGASGGKMGTGRAGPRDLRGLARSWLSAGAPEVVAELASSSGVPAAGDGSPGRFGRTPGGQHLPDAPPTLQEGGVIRDGYDAELDEIRAIRDGPGTSSPPPGPGAGANGDRLPEGGLQQGLRVLPGGHQGEPGQGPGGLRPKADAGQRRALLHAGAEGVGGEGLRGRGPDRTLEAELFGGVREEVAGEVRRIQETAGRIAELDVLATLAEVAVDRGYVRPEVHTGFEMDIRGGAAPGGGDDDARGGVHPQRSAAGRGGPHHRPHRAQHGGKEHGPQAGGADSAPGPDRGLRSGRRGPPPGYATGSSPGWERRIPWPGASPPSWWR